MAINIEELLSELEGAEKTAEETFVSNVTSEKSPEATEEKVAEAEEKEEAKEEKVAEAEAEVETEEKVAEKSETETEEKAEEKVAEAQESEEEKVEEKVAEASDQGQEKELVKQAMDMGRIAAHTFYAELVALGIMPPTNKDMVVPPISSVSLPSESPVTLKADAAIQEAVGHDGYDARAPQAKKGQEKKASVITPEFLTNLHNKIYSEE